MTNAGQFKKGNKSGGGKKGKSGRKPKAEELGIIALLQECFTPKDRRDVIRKLVEDAKSDDAKLRSQARPLLLAYAFGKPKEHQDAFDFNPADLNQLDDYELELFIAGHDPRPLFAAASRRAAREAAKASAKKQ